MECSSLGLNSHSVKQSDVNLLLILPRFKQYNPWFGRSEIQRMEVKSYRFMQFDRVERSLLPILKPTRIFHSCWVRGRNRIRRCSTFWISSGAWSSDDIFKSYMWCFRECFCVGPSNSICWLFCQYRLIRPAGRRTCVSSLVLHLILKPSQRDLDLWPRGILRFVILLMTEFS